VEGLLTQTPSITGNRANNTENAIPRIGGGPRTRPLSFSENDIESSGDTDWFISDISDFPGLIEDHPPLQSIASTHPAGFGFAPSPVRWGSSPIMNLFGEVSDVRLGYDGNRTTFSPINDDIVHTSGSSGPYASGALQPAQPPGLDEEDIPVDALMHYLGRTGIENYRVQHREDGRSILRIRTPQLRDSLLFTSAGGNHS
jgi:hypothetical protein